MERTVVTPAFTCPDCAATIAVGDAVVPEILEAGCVACGSAVTRGAFESE